jgi:hypothetical protein
MKDRIKQIFATLALFGLALLAAFFAGYVSGGDDCP